MISSFPAEPDAGERATGNLPLRYEDVAQDGRLSLHALPQALGAVVWARLASGHPLAAARARGVVAVLARLTVEGFGGPIPVGHPLRAEGTWRFAHTADESGEPDRILLDMWASAHGIKGRIHGPRPADAGQAIVLGRVFARHVISRPFAAPGERKVTRLEVPGLEPVPARRETWRAAQALLELPEGAVPLEAGLAPDAADLVFGLCHTDSNQHVNSLVYPRLFEEALLRRLQALGRATTVLSRFVDVGYRKPFFAGQRARILLRAFTLGEQLGAVGAFVSEGAPDRPHAYLTMIAS